MSGLDRYVWGCFVTTDSSEQNIDFETRVRRDVERLQSELGLVPGADLQMIILKGHLLIEELLQSFIDSVVHSRTALSGARLTFHQRFALAKSLHTCPARFGYGWVRGAGGDRGHMPDTGTNAGAANLKVCATRVHF